MPKARTRPASQSAGHGRCGTGRNTGSREPSGDRLNDRRVGGRVVVVGGAVVVDVLVVVVLVADVLVVVG